MPLLLPSSLRRWLPALQACLAGLMLLVAAGVAPAQTAGPPEAADPELRARAEALGRAHDAVVGVAVRAVPDARSAETLGLLRAGSGIVIGDDGLVLTIGYLILEADRVDLVLDAERSVPARVVAYDLATGFGLVQALVPLKTPVARLGSAAALADEELLMIASGGPQSEVSIAQLIARRAFSGYWEYHIDGALFTAPARMDHSGAGLFNGRGELVGVGSLVVTDTLGPDRPRLPGNMFVPVDLLGPILGELRSQGRSAASRRAWLGLNCDEQDGRVRVLKVSAASPAESAGVEAGDQILAIDGSEVHGLEALWKTLWRGRGAEREVTLDIRRGEERRTLKLQSVDRMTTLRRAQGI